MSATAVAGDFILGEADGKGQFLVGNSKIKYGHTAFYFHSGLLETALRSGSLLRVVYFPIGMMC